MTVNLRLYQEPYPETYPTAPDQPYYQQYQDLQRSTTAAIIIAYLCLIVDIIGLVTGMTMFMNRINVFQSFVHFWGSIFTCWFVCKFLSNSTPRMLTMH
jgi:arginine exporter protein ArgO